MYKMRKTNVPRPRLWYRMHSGDYRRLELISRETGRKITDIVRLFLQFFFYFEGALLLKKRRVPTHSNVRSSVRITQEVADSLVTYSKIYKMPKNNLIASIVHYFLKAIKITKLIGVLNQCIDLKNFLLGALKEDTSSLKRFSYLFAGTAWRPQ